MISHVPTPHVVDEYSDYKALKQNEKPPPGTSIEKNHADLVEVQVCWQFSTPASHMFWTLTRPGRKGVLAVQPHGGPKFIRNPHDHAH